jgi:hypothetical protein
MMVAAPTRSLRRPTRCAHSQGARYSGRNWIGKIVVSVSTT